FGKLKMVTAVHSSVLPDGTYAGNPGGFVITNAEGTFYIAGDTALTLDMKLIPMTCPKLDFAILPIGDNFTMGISDALIASDFIECPKIVGCHYDTFGYIKIDHPSAQKAFSAKGKELILLPLNESTNLG
ncbi:MAG TPA: hydrolase, partial [Haliscomenobacter sp.]|nr:hydrolase [Haliscomenobacter sp.]